jgi:hypothetical protein
LFMVGDLLFTACPVCCQSVSTLASLFISPSRDGFSLQTHIKWVEAGLSFSF